MTCLPTAYIVLGLEESNDEVMVMIQSRISSMGVGHLVMAGIVR